MHCACRSYETEKRCCRSPVYRKHHPNEKLKSTCIMVFSALADFIDCCKGYYSKQPPRRRELWEPATKHHSRVQQTPERTRRSSTRTKQTMRITMREPRKERTVRTIINLPQNQEITTSTTMGVYRCCGNGCWFALVFWCKYFSFFVSFVLHRCDCTWPVTLWRNYLNNLNKRTKEA